MSGLTNRAIAKRLVVSERTVVTHLTRVFKKLDVSSRAELVARLLAHPVRQTGHHPTTHAGNYLAAVTISLSVGSNLGQS